MDSERSEVMMEHVRECLDHFGETLKGLKGTKEATARKKPMAEFCGIDVASVTRWLGSEDLVPNGGVLIKLMCFLTILGYRVIEFEDIPKLFRNFLELIGFGILTPKEAAGLIGYSQKNGENEIYRLTRKRDGNVLNHRREAILRVWKEKKEALDRKKKEAEERYLMDFLSGLPSAKPTVLSLVQPEHSAAPASSASSLAVINIMTGLLGLLEGSGNELSNGMICSLSQSDAQVVLRLSGCLSQISSKLILRSQEKGG